MNDKLRSSLDERNILWIFHPFERRISAMMQTLPCSTRERNDTEFGLPNGMLSFFVKFIFHAKSCTSREDLGIKLEK